MSIRTHAIGCLPRTKVAGRALPLAALLAATLLFGAAVAPAQAAPRADAQADNRDWNREGDTLAGAVGLHYGKIGGTGLSFRLPLKWFLYAQVAGGVWNTNDDQRHNVGVQLQYLLRQDARMRLFAGVGLASYYHREKTGTGPDGDIFAEDTDWNYGAGVGVEILQGSRWAWLFELDFVHEESTGNTTVSPQAGISYYW